MANENEKKMNKVNLNSKKQKKMIKDKDAEIRRLKVELK